MNEPIGVDELTDDTVSTGTDQNSESLKNPSIDESSNIQDDHIAENKAQLSENKKSYQMLTNEEFIKRQKFVYNFKTLYGIKNESVEDGTVLQLPADRMMHSNLHMVNHVSQNLPASYQPFQQKFSHFCEKSVQSLSEIPQSADWLQMRSRGSVELPRPPVISGSNSSSVPVAQKDMLDQRVNQYTRNTSNLNFQKSTTGFGFIPFTHGRIAQANEQISVHRGYQNEMSSRTINLANGPPLTPNQSQNYAQQMKQKQPNSINNLQIPENMANNANRVIARALPNFTMLSTYINQDFSGFSAADLFKIMSIHHFISSFGTLFWPDDDFSRLTLDETISLFTNIQSNFEPLLMWYQRLISVYYAKDQIYIVQNQVYNFLLEDHPELAETFRMNEFLSIPISDLVEALLLLFEGLAFVLEEHESRISKQYRQFEKDIYGWNLEINQLRMKSKEIHDNSKGEVLNPSAITPNVTSTEHVQLENEMGNKIEELQKKIFNSREASKPLLKIMNDFKSRYGPGYLGADRLGRGYWAIKIKNFSVILVDENHFKLDRKEEKISFIANVYQLGHLMGALDQKNPYEKELFISLQRYISTTEDCSPQNRYIKFRVWLMTLKRLPLTPLQVQSYSLYYSNPIKEKLLDVVSICKFTKEMKKTIMLLDKEPFQTYKSMLIKWYTEGRFSGGTNYRMHEFFIKVQTFSHFFKWLINFKKYYKDGVLKIDDVEEIVKLKPKMIMKDYFGISSELDEADGPIKFSPIKTRKKEFKYRMENDIEGESEDDYVEENTTVHQRRFPKKARRTKNNVDDLECISEWSSSEEESTRKMRNIRKNLMDRKDKPINYKDANKVGDHMKVYSTGTDYQSEHNMVAIDMNLQGSEQETDVTDEDIILDYRKMKVVTIECPSLVYLS